jgi:hypothetical protein
MPNYKPPTNGFDKRPTAINRHGRPKGFDEWRNLNKETMNELATDGSGSLIVIKTPKIVRGKPVLDEQGKPEMEEHYATNAEMIVRSKMRDPKRQQDTIEAAFGKVPDKVDVTSNGKDLTTIINVKLTDESDD